MTKWLPGNQNVGVDVDQQNFWKQKRTGADREPTKILKKGIDWNKKTCPHEIESVQRNLRNNSSLRLWPKIFERPTKSLASYGLFEKLTKKLKISNKLKEYFSNSKVHQKVKIYIFEDSNSLQSLWRNYFYCFDILYIIYSQPKKHTSALFKKNPSQKNFDLYHINYIIESLLGQAVVVRVSFTLRLGYVQQIIV